MVKDNGASEAAKSLYPVAQLESWADRIEPTYVVGVARIELATPAMSTQCSTTELHAHSGTGL